MLGVLIPFLLPVYPGAPPRRSSANAAQGGLTPAPERPTPEGQNFAVGTALAGGPPHRSQRAGLPHWAPASGTSVETHLWMGVHDAGGGEPPGGEAVHAAPSSGYDAGCGAGAPEPVPCHLVRKLHRLAVAWHGVVGEMASHHACQPYPLLGDGQMPASLSWSLTCELGPHLFRDRDAPQARTARPGLPADVGKAQESERLRLAEAPLPACSAAYRPNSIRRVLSACSSSRTSRIARAGRAGTALHHLDARTRPRNRPRSAR